MSSDDDDLQARIDAAIEAFREMCERQMQAEFDRIAERYAEEPAPPRFPYQPDTEHPSYTSKAPFVRHLMAEGRRHIKLPVPLSRRALFASPDEPYPTGPTLEYRVLDVRRAAGPAPYVGEPFAYMWDVAVDEMGRWIAGPTRIVRSRWAESVRPL